ncbi:acylneuraminate cytidylyltransferase [Halarcobacter mediterraneus]|uniref:Acylneuraminate cytidylyltransferase n=1 Tax=Halarcobacter mediterraneus TaxID=2023153 RepID=A0A4Q1AVU8_9BACT|nr:acylneuraminate cytidylyltransferase family protein [Halarcobacter mediterraneus]RXK13596.1 acylneuraminate cytidylyltransferase [Halarcobacter mediterraneus]
MNHKISVFLPVRSGSTRVINKNTKLFSNDSSLLQIKLQQLIKTSTIDEIIVSTNCNICLNQAQDFLLKDSRIKLIKRSDELANGKTTVKQMLTHMCKLVSYDHILYTHVTSPFINNYHFDDAITKYNKLIDNNNIDSMISVNKIQNFILDKKGNLINNKISENKWPNTQDLDVLYEMNHAFYLASKKLFQTGDRVGKNPFYYECVGTERIDIDWEDDFTFAQKVYKLLYESKKQ